MPCKRDKVQNQRRHRMAAKRVSKKLFSTAHTTPILCLLIVAGDALLRHEVS